MEHLVAAAIAIAGAMHYEGHASACQAAHALRAAILRTMAHPLPRLSLTYLAPEQELLSARLLELTPGELERPSNLPGWSVLDLAVHITRVCDSILLAVQ